MRNLFLRVVLTGVVVMSSANAASQTFTVSVKMDGTVPVVLANAQFLAHHDPSSQMRLTVVMKLRNPGQLDTLLRDIQDPTSPQYHQFLSPEQFDEQYGPTQDQVAAVENYLGSNGIHIDDVTPDNMLIHAQAASGEIEQALGVIVNDYNYDGRKVYIAADDPRLPAGIANYVQSILGLSDVIQLHPMYTLDSKVSDTTGTTTLNSSSTPVGYSPQQIATAYNWPSITNTSDGQGITIAIATAASYGLLSSDYNYFWDYYSLPRHTVTIINVDGTSQQSDGTAETTLDIERSGAMAPGATINVYEGYITDPATFIDVYDRIVTDNVAQVMTTSWGLPEGNWTKAQWQAADAVFKKGVAQGIAFVAADGDGGSSDCRVAPCTSTANNPDYPSSDPYVVAAGGTTMTLNSNNTIASETAWSYSCGTSGACSGTGGAESALFTPEPSWQVGSGVPQNGYRNTSDISMDADAATGYSMYFQGGWVAGPDNHGSEGTSFVAPQIAALLAVQMSASSTRLGQANTALYIDANSSTYSADFHDVISGNNGAYYAGIGWDHPTGWGSPNAANLIGHIAGSAAISAPQNLTAEYTQCVNYHDKYFISWDPGPVGTAMGYDAEYEYVGGTWTSFAYEPGRTANLSLTPNSHVSIRVRATNGSHWSSYTSTIFYSAPCSPPP